jgi:hypothetical protein
MSKNSLIEGYGLVVEYTEKNTFNDKAVEVRVYDCFNYESEIICFYATIYNLKNQERKSKYFDDMGDAERWAFSESKKITSNQTQLYSKGK